MSRQHQFNNFNQTTNEDHQVKVFLRINSCKKGTDFKCNSQITESELVQLLHRIIEQNQLLKKALNDCIDQFQFIIEGHKLSPNGSQTLILRQNSIIHLLNQSNSNQQKINVTFRYQNPQQDKDISHQVSVQTNHKIQQIASDIIPIYFSKFLNEVSLVYLGAQINFSDTFKNAHIQNNSEIIVIDKLKTFNQSNDQFQNAQQISLSSLGIRPQTVSIAQQPKILVMGLNMPYNPKIAADKVKKILQSNVIQTQLFAQQNILNQNAQAAPALIGINQPSQSQGVNSTGQIQQKMDEQNNIPTKEQIESQKNIESQQKK